MFYELIDHYYGIFDYFPASAFDFFCSPFSKSGKSAFNDYLSDISRRDFINRVAGEHINNNANVCSARTRGEEKRR